MHQIGGRTATAARTRCIPNVAELDRNTDPAERPRADPRTRGEPTSGSISNRDLALSGRGIDTQGGRRATGLGNGHGREQACARSGTPAKTSEQTWAGACVRAPGSWHVHRTGIRVVAPLVRATVQTVSRSALRGALTTGSISEVASSVLNDMLVFKLAVILVPAIIVAFCFGAGGYLANLESGRVQAAGQAQAKPADQKTAQNRPAHARRPKLVAPSGVRATAGRGSFLVYVLDENDRRNPTYEEKPEAHRWVVVTGLLDHLSIRKSLAVSLALAKKGGAASLGHTRITGESMSNGKSAGPEARGRPGRKSTEKRTALSSRTCPKWRASKRPSNSGFRLWLTTCHSSRPATGRGPRSRDWSRPRRKNPRSRDQPDGPCVPCFQLRKHPRSWSDRSISRSNRDSVTVTNCGSSSMPPMVSASGEKWSDTGASRALWSRPRIDSSPRKLRRRLNCLGARWRASISVWGCSRLRPCDNRTDPAHRSPGAPDEVEVGG